MPSSHSKIGIVKWLLAMQNSMPVLIVKDVLEAEAARQESLKLCADPGSAITSVFHRCKVL